MFAIGSILLVNAAFFLNNLAPYFGVPHLGAMTMFSGLSVGKDNHFFMPTAAFGEEGIYVVVERFAPSDPNIREAREFEAFAEWADQENSWISLNMLRYHADRICRTAPGTSLRLSARAESGQRYSAQNACLAPALRRYVPLPISFACKPACERTIRKWAQGRLFSE